MFNRDLVVASFCFVLSGAAALVYQVAWQRLLALTTGVSIPSVAAITRDEFARPRERRKIKAIAR